MPSAEDQALQIFISHSSHDMDVAEAVIDLLRSALDIPPNLVRCTSVDGYRLPAGASTDEQLQREVRTAQCFIAILTHSSLQAPYVLFELGARWGARLPCIPLLARGLEPGALVSPLKALNALTCASGAQLHQLVTDVGQKIHRTANPPAVFEKHIRKLQGYASSSAAPKRAQRSPPAERPRVHLSTSAKEFLRLIEEESDPDSRGIVEILQEVEPGQTCFFPKIQYSGNPSSMKTRLFRDHIAQLIAHNHLFPPEHNPSTDTRTYEYRKR